MQEMLDKVFETITRQKLVEKGDTVLVAVSGGPDSVCLLHALHVLAEKLEIKLAAVHINHMLRGEESEGDENYTRELCVRLEVDLYCRSVDIRQLSQKEGLSLEEAGREARYKEFELLADRTGAAVIAVAHNKNDQAETILMNIIRGTGLQGLAGMEHRRGRIIRPLLDISRHEIENYCRENELNPRTDSSNLKGDFTRNRIRLELIPGINRSFGGDITESLHRMASLVRCDNSYLETEARKACEVCVDEQGKAYVFLKLDQLKALHPAICGRVLRMAVGRVKGNIKGIAVKHIDDITELIFRSRTGSSIMLPGGIRAEISYSRLKIHINNESGKKIRFNQPVIIPGSNHVEELGATMEASLENIPVQVDKYDRIGYNSLVQFFDYDRLKQGINIRNRREGDVFSPLKSNGSRKLKEYFIDIKMPREKREEIPLIALDNEIVWVVGNKISDKFKVTENTKRVLKLSFTGSLFTNRRK